MNAFPKKIVSAKQNTLSKQIISPKQNTLSKQIIFPKKIVDFIKEHHVLTLAVSNDSDIWCSHAFYEFMEDELVFIITSEEKTRHIQLLSASDKNAGAASGLETDKNTGDASGLEKVKNIVAASGSETDKNTGDASGLGADFGNGLRTVAGAIALETETIGLIRGLQFKAQISKCEESYLNRYRIKYLKRFPYAILKGGDLWLLKLTEAKYTDNRLGFGKKLCWHQ